VRETLWGATARHRKKAVGHKGFVLSDWGATHTATKAALSGLDMEQPGSNWFGDKLKES